MKNRRNIHSTSPHPGEVTPYTSAYLRSFGLEPWRIRRFDTTHQGYWEYEFDVNGGIVINSDSISAATTWKEWPEGFDWDEFQDAMRKDGLRL